MRSGCVTLPSRLSWRGKGNSFGHRVDNGRSARTFFHWHFQQSTYLQAQVNAPSIEHPVRQVEDSASFLEDLLNGNTLGHLDEEPPKDIGSARQRSDRGLEFKGKRGDAFRHNYLFP